jgi:hypothetical protein
MSGLSIPVKWENGEVGRVPFDELDFKNRRDEYQAADEHSFSEWEKASLYAHYKETGMQQVTLSATYSGICVSVNGSAYPVPVEHLSDISHVWGLPLLDRMGKGLKLTDEQKKSYGMPAGEIPPFPTRLYALDDKLDKFVPVDPSKENLVGKFLLFDHPCLDTPAPWPFNICDVQPVLSAAGTTEQSKPLFVSGSSFFTDDVRPEYLIKSLIEANSDVMIVGPSGEGKTFVILCAGVAISVGGLAFGSYQCKQGAVLYLAGEGHGGVKRRVRAIAKNLGLSPDELKHFYVSTTTIEFDGSGLREAIAEARKIEAEHGVSIRLIVVDTLHRHMIGEENSAKDTGEYIRSVQHLRESFPGSVTCTVHHGGHGENTSSRGRGSSAVPAAMDAIILCNKGLLTFTKMKDGAIPEPIEFKLMPVEIGTDEDGQPVTSCVVEYGARAQKHRVPVLTGQERIIVRLLDDTESKSELIGDLRKRFYDYRRNLDPEVTTNALKNAYLKAIPSLIEKQVLRQDENLISLVVPEQTVTVTSPSLLIQNDGLNRPSPSPLYIVESDEVTVQVTVPVLELTAADFEGIEL